jgi:acyl phosphate:glycerol-3-phosphate acyltransferase
MITILTHVGVLLLSYLIGAIPFGFLFVWFIKRKDITQEGSGRTGGTNAMRAGGVAAGILTGLLDVIKGAATVWIVRRVMPGQPWMDVLAPIMAILGHNYSIFLIERGRDERLKLRGGAGGATCGGGVFGLWPGAAFILLPFAFLVWYGVGYASITTLAIGLLSILIFLYRSWMGLSPWQYIFYGIIAELILLWALRPNLIRLRNGTERLHGWRARRQKKQD